jgi:hypothetical protein
MAVRIDQAGHQNYIAQIQRWIAPISGHIPPPAHSSDAFARD